MHTLSRSLPGKGACVKRISRWHPYNQLSSHTTISPHSDDFVPHAPISMSQKCTISSSVYVHTPVSIGSSSSSSSSDHLTFSTRNVSVASIPTERDRPSFAFSGGLVAQEDRSSFARCLIDRAVKLLSDAWLPISYCSFPQPLNLLVEVSNDTSRPRRAHNPAYLPSPNTPSQTPPSLSPPPTALPYPYQSTAEHMPLRQFVHEVLRRSRTSCTSLQTALCYVEAVSLKLPALIAEEMQRIDLQNASSILVDEITHETADKSGFDTSDGNPESPVPPIQMAINEPGASAENSKSRKHRPPAQILPPLPPAPSPLLCPRRTFLASLLLASKFLQDRSYSNKAWAKLTGLAPREIGRCERALADALEWRLWVGKGADLPFPADSMDDGGLVVPVENAYKPSCRRATFVAAPLSQNIRRERRLSKSKSDGELLARNRDAIASGLLSGTDNPPSASSWSSIPVPLTLSPSGIVAIQTDKAGLPLVGIAGGHSPTDIPPSRLAWHLERERTGGELASSLSTPSSLLDTQSSVSSVSSFPEICTPPSTLVLPGARISYGCGPSVPTEPASGFLDIEIEEIVGRV